MRLQHLVILSFSLSLIAQANDSIDLEMSAKIMAETHLEKTGEKMRSGLDALGHTPEEVERILGRYFQQVAHCTIDALVAQTTAESLPLEPYLRFFEKGRGGPDELELLTAIDFQALKERINPCTAAAYHQTGLQN